MNSFRIVRHALGSMHLIGGIVLLAVGGVFCGIASTVFLEERAYKAGLQADAVVVAKHMRPATADSSTAYELTYRVRSSAGEEWQKVETVDAATWDGVEQGEMIRVQYLAGNSGSVRVARAPRDVPLAFVAALTGGLALLGLWMLSRGAQEIWRRVRLYRHGQPAEATVVAVRETNVAINRRLQWAIDFTYLDHLGQPHNGSSEPLAPAEAFEWQEGDKAIIRFDPQRPADSVWVGEPQTRNA